MKPPADHPWPPLISHAKVPWYIRGRDWFFTVLAWLAMAFLLRLGILLLWDYFSYPIFELTWTNTHDWAVMWQHLSGFIDLIVFVMIWIIVWGTMRRAELRRTFDPQVTPSLSLEEHATSLSLDPHEVERWRKWRIVTVHFVGDHIASARPGGPKDTDMEADVRNPEGTTV